MVLAALFLVFVPGKPAVRFGTSAPNGTGNGFIVYVTSVSQPIPASSVRLDLVADGIAGAAVPLAPYMNVTVSGDAYFAAWNDVTHDHQVTVGDGFAVSRYGYLSGSVFTLQLVWSDARWRDPATGRSIDSRHNREWVRVLCRGGEPDSVDRELPG